MDYVHGTVTVTTTVSSINVCATNDGTLLKNQGTVVVYIGGPSVTADETSTGGYPISAGEALTLPTVGNGSRPLYLVTASGSATVSFIQPLLNV